MIICSDMLEHLSEKEGIFLLNLIKEKSKFAMIVTPVRVLQQQAIYDNEHERHISAWPMEILSKWGEVFQFENTYLLEMSSALQAKNGDTIKIHYTGKLQDGTIFATTQNKPPVQLTLGKGQAIPGLENALIGMAPGQRTTAKISSEDAHGPYRKDMTQTIERSQFPSHIQPVIGQILQDHQEDGRIINVTVTDVSTSSVTLDANHPLAGKDLIFDIQLVGIL
jgi:FKBP-type peptidyl-prolyl cis-trans isomerase 2